MPTTPSNCLKEYELNGIDGKAIEIKAVFRPSKARELGLKVLRSPDGEEYTVVKYSSRQELSVDTSHSSLLENAKSRSPETGPLVLGKDEPLELRVFIDRSIIEVFANSRQCLGVRVYPKQDNSRGISVFSNGANTELLSLEIWQMHSYNILLVLPINIS